MKLPALPSRTPALLHVLLPGASGEPAQDSAAIAATRPDTAPSASFSLFSAGNATFERMANADEPGQKLTEALANPQRELI